MGAIVNLASGGCVLLAGVASFELIGARNAGEASVTGPPVISDRDLPDAPGTPRPAPGKPRAVSFYADRYGQFWIDGTANGATFRFLADSGASAITFNKRDARRLGLDVGRLTFDGLSSTANGLTRTASARVANFKVGPFSFADVPVQINEGDLDFPLLGMAFLRRMNVSMSNGMLTLSGEP